MTSAPPRPAGARRRWFVAALAAGLAAGTGCALLSAEPVPREAAAWRSPWHHTLRLAVAGPGPVQAASLRLNGAPVRFLIACGRGDSTLDAGRAAALGLAAWPDSRLRMRAAGPPPRLDLGPLAFDGDRLRIESLARLNDRLRQAGYPPIDGCLGLTALADLGAVHDVRGATLLLPRERNAARQLDAFLTRRGWRRAALEVAPGGRGLLAAVSVNGRPARLRLDTGAARTALSEDAAQRLGAQGAPPEAAKEDDGRIAVAARMAGEGWSRRLVPIRILRTGAPDNADGILGMDVLADLGAWIDHGAGALFVRPDSDR